MTSKEGLKLLETRCRFFAQDEDELQETYEAREAIKKDLEILECFKKIPKQDLREFIEWQLRYEKIIKNWLDERPFLYVDKEDPTKHLIKIKEWLDEKEKEERMEND